MSSGGAFASAGWRGRGGFGESVFIDRRAGMVFTSPVFVFYFLLRSLAAYDVSPEPLAACGITAFSDVFYGWWNPWFVLLMGGGTIVDYGGTIVDY